MFLQFYYDSSVLHSVYIRWIVGGLLFYPWENGNFLSTLILFESFHEHHDELQVSHLLLVQIFSIEKCAIRYTPENILQLKSSIFKVQT